MAELAGEMEELPHWAGGMVEVAELAGGLVEVAESAGGMVEVAEPAGGLAEGVVQPQLNEQAVLARVQRRLERQTAASPWLRQACWLPVLQTPPGAPASPLPCR